VSTSAELTANIDRPREMNDLVVVSDLVKHFPKGRQTLRAVDGVSFDIQRGEVVGLAGESGSGKSTVARLLTRLHEPTSGKIVFDGTDLTRLRGKKLREMRKDIQLVFQNPYASLNPRMTIGESIGYPLKNFGISGQEYHARILEVLEACGLRESTLRRFPHEFSGGQRQRVGIARALVLKPAFMVLDEPISALDVSIQAQIVNLLGDLQQQYGLTYLFIGHDLSILRHLCDRVLIMYLGKIVEAGETERVFENPLHPYTRALLDAVPTADPEIAYSSAPEPLRGDVPSAVAPPSGCRFNPRCPLTQVPACTAIEPPLEQKGAKQAAACHLVAPA
jgi:oligopeptide/dipeptide ABC transporter ATP-binding protein